MKAKYKVVKRHDGKVNRDYYSVQKKILGLFWWEICACGTLKLADEFVLNGCTFRQDKIIQSQNLYSVNFKPIFKGLEGQCPKTISNNDL